MLRVVGIDIKDYLIESLVDVDKLFWLGDMRDQRKTERGSSISKTRLQNHWGRRLDHAPQITALARFEKLRFPFGTGSFSLNSLIAFLIGSLCLPQQEHELNEKKGIYVDSLVHINLEFLR